MIRSSLMPTKRQTLIFEKNDPERLDLFLVNSFEGISRVYLQELIQKGIVQVNGAKVRKGYLLNRGDKLVIESFLRPEEREIEPCFDVAVPIVWESKDFVVVNKPAGLPTHPNDFEDQKTLANALLAKYPEIRGVGEDTLRPGIVHRLDTDTSGLLMVARNQDKFQRLRKLFDERKIKKTYLALALGKVEKTGEINEPLAHHPTNPRKMVVVSKVHSFRSVPRQAKTFFEPVESFKNYTVLRVKTLTGRMHQVRVHLSFIGHPLAGDRLYQTAKEKRMDQTNLSRHFLHALELCVPWEGGHEKIFHCELPQELSGLLQRLRENV